MGTNTVIRGQYRSNWAILLFLMVMSVAAFYSEIYQAPQDNSVMYNREMPFFSEGKLKNIDTIVIKNKRGNFALHKKTPTGHMWELTRPSNLPANRVPIEELIKSLQNIKVRKIHRPDTVNISNFSMDNPHTTITVTNRKGESSIIKFGLINSIDKSTYISISGHQKIYHVDALKHNASSIGLNDLINSSVFSFEQNDVVSIKVSKFNRQTKFLKINLTRKEKVWKNSRGKVAEDSAIVNFLKELQSIKSHVILDSVNQKLKDKIDFHMKTPLYVIEVGDIYGQIVKYSISGPLRTLPGLKIEKWKNFLVTVSNIPFTYLLNGDVLKTFAKEPKHFKKLPIKKLFY